MPNTVKVLKLTTDEKNSLECLLRCPTTEARKYIRAKILLLKSDSYTNEAIADKLDITVSSADAVQFFTISVLFRHFMCLLYNTFTFLTSISLIFLY